MMTTTLPQALTVARQVASAAASLGVRLIGVQLGDLEGSPNSAGIAVHVYDVNADQLIAFASAVLDGSEQITSKREEMEDGKVRIDHVGIADNSSHRVILRVFGFLPAAVPCDHSSGDVDALRHIDGRPVADCSDCGETIPMISDPTMRLAMPAHAAVVIEMCSGDNDSHTGAIGTAEGHTPGHADLFVRLADGDVCVATEWHAATDQDVADEAMWRETQLGEAGFVAPEVIRGCAHRAVANIIRPTAEGAQASGICADCRQPVVEVFRVDGPGWVRA